MARAKTEKPIFKGLVICVAGDLGRDWSDEAILRWVKLRDGTVVQEMNDSVTHLLCHMDDFKRKCSKVRYALRKLTKSCHIVTSDWLEHSLAKKRKLKEKPYLLQTAYRAERIALAKDFRAKQAALPKKQPENFVIKDLYHIYSDETYFRYEVELVRVSHDHPEDKKLNERYILYLFESNAKPHSYAFATKFIQKEGSRPLHWRPSPYDRNFKAAFKEFEEFFERKTNIDWMARLAEAGTKGPLSFHYTPPIGGKPVGVVTGKYAKFVHQSRKSVVDGIVQMVVDEAVKSTLTADEPNAPDDMTSDEIQNTVATAHEAEADNRHLKNVDTAKLLYPRELQGEDNALEGVEVASQAHEGQIVPDRSAEVDPRTILSIQATTHVGGMPREAKKSGLSSILHIPGAIPGAVHGVASVVGHPPSHDDNIAQDQSEEMMAKPAVDYLAG